jgi:hypothetical protein
VLSSQILIWSQTSISKLVPQVLISYTKYWFLSIQSRLFSVYTSGQSFTVILLYVDDMIITGNDDDAI